MSRVEHWQDVLETHTIEPLHRFPGDNFEPAEYTAAVYNWYSEKLSTFQIGAEACGLTVAGPHRLERARRVMALACWIDEYLDEPQAVQTARAEQFIRGAKAAQRNRGQGWEAVVASDDPALSPRPELRTALQLVESATAQRSGFDPSLRRRFLTHAQLIGNSAIVKARQTDTQSYIRQLRNESDSFAEILAGSYLQSLPQRLQDRRWAGVVRKLMRTTVLIDCALDLPNDRQEDRVALESGIGRRTRIAAAGVQDFFRANSDGQKLNASDVPVLKAMYREYRQVTKTRLDDGKAPALPLPAKR